MYDIQEGAEKRNIKWDNIENRQRNPERTLRKEKTNMKVK